MKLPLILIILPKIICLNNLLILAISDFTIYRQHSSNDETGSSSGSAEQIYLPPRGRRTRGRTAAGTRPATSKLERPSVSDMDIPNIR